MAPLMSDEEKGKHLLREMKENPEIINDVQEDKRLASDEISDADAEVFDMIPEDPGSLEPVTSAKEPVPSEGIAVGDGETDNLPPEPTFTKQPEEEKTPEENPAEESVHLLSTSSAPQGNSYPPTEIISVKHSHSKRKVTRELELGTTLQEAIDLYGEDVVYYNFRLGTSKACRSHLVYLCQGASAKPVNEAEKAANKWKPLDGSHLRKQKDPVEELNALLSGPNSEVVKAKLAKLLEDVE